MYHFYFKTNFVILPIVHKFYVREHCYYYHLITQDCDAKPSVESAVFQYIDRGIDDLEEFAEVLEEDYPNLKDLWLTQNWIGDGNLLKFYQTMRARGLRSMVIEVSQSDLPHELFHDIEPPADGLIALHDPDRFDHIVKLGADLDTSADWYNFCHMYAFTRTGINSAAEFASRLPAAMLNPEYARLKQDILQHGLVPDMRVPELLMYHKEIWELYHTHHMGDPEWIPRYLWTDADHRKYVEDDNQRILEYTGSLLQTILWTHPELVDIVGVNSVPNLESQVPVLQYLINKGELERTRARTEKLLFYRKIRLSDLPEAERPEYYAYVLKRDFEWAITDIPVENQTFELLSQYNYENFKDLIKNKETLARMSESRITTHYIYLDAEERRRFCDTTLLLEPQTYDTVYSLDR